MNLVYNQIASLFNEKEVPFNTGNLTYLFLECNQITSLFNEKGEQFDIGKVKHLFLQNNKITSLSNKDGVRFNIDTIIQLTLDYNPIELLIPDYPEIKDIYDLRIYQRKLTNYIRDKKVKSARK